MRNSFRIIAFFVPPPKYLTHIKSPITIGDWQFCDMVSQRKPRGTSFDVQPIRIFHTRTENLSSRLRR